MKSFKFRYSKTVWILLYIVLLLSVSGICWNLFNLFTFINDGAFKTVAYALIILLTAFLLVFVISVMAYGRYVIKDKEIIQYFGFLKSKILLDDIIAITHFKKSNKLVMYFKDAKYTVIVISPSEYDDFVVSIRKINPSILFSSKIDGEDLPE